MENYIILNAGSVGVSIDGIGGTACYALITEYDQNYQPKVTFHHVSYDVEEAIRKSIKSGMTEMAPGISRAIIAELRTGRAYLGSVLQFCHSYAERQLGRKVEAVPVDLWKEAEQLWDGAEYLEYRML